MNELEFKLGDIDIVVAVVQRNVEEAGKPYLDWLECNLRVSTPSFSGSVSWNVMPQELLALADDLIRLYDEFPKRGSLAFEPTEPNLTIDLKIGTTGAVEGECSIRDDIVYGDSLQCQSTIEQNQLPRLANDVRAFVQYFAPAA